MFIAIDLGDIVADPHQQTEFDHTVQGSRSAISAVALGIGEACWHDGERAERIGFIELRRRFDAGAAPLLCFRPAVARRLGVRRFRCFDAMELFAFVRPAHFCLPTIRGLAAALGLAPPHTLAQEIGVVIAAARALLRELSDPEHAREPDLKPIAAAMSAGGWNWAPLVSAALSMPPAGNPARALSGLEVWHRLPEWAERAPEPPAGNTPVGAEEALTRLGHLLGSNAEARPQQRDYAAAVAYAFTPRDAPEAPRAVLAEAGTGVGKTLGYVAPASLWSEKNGGAVWISTYTKNLQHQVDRVLDRLYPAASEKRRRVAIRKGRENYLCLLNFEDEVAATRMRLADAPAIGLLARWLAHTRDGALVAGDLPGWLIDLVGRNVIAGMTDRRGECVYAACPHYGRCFIEHGVRRARRARLVVANHALVMVQAALAGSEGDEGAAPTRYVFDEGHHVFAAADAAFAAHLTGQEMRDLRLWVRGPESGSSRRSRARGVRARLGELIEGDDAADRLLTLAVVAAGDLPGEGWLARIAAGGAGGAGERFLRLVRQQVYARDAEHDNGYALECGTQPPVPGLLEAADELKTSLVALAQPLLELAARLAARLNDEAAKLEPAARIRLDGLARGIRRRTDNDLAAWQAMLSALRTATPPAFVDWFGVERDYGRERDIGHYRHWIDPTVPFAEHVLSGAHGVLVTSASLRDSTGAEGDDWSAAEAQVGTRHLAAAARRVAVDSPFDYPRQTRLYVVRDVRYDDAEQVAAAFRELFVAARGGALGLFTAIARLRGVHERIAADLEMRGIMLLAQHVDGYDVATLVDIFRAEPDSCLLGTDAVRDGIDVPGRSLRLVVFDRVPWPRPDILFKARRDAFGGARYTDREARFRLRQAFGRLIRRADDSGVFVMLDSRLPSRLATAFPPGVDVRRVGLAEAVAGTREFLSASAG